MKTLNRNDLEKVAPTFRPLVQAAWDKGEEVPEGIIYVSDEPLSEEDIARTKQLVVEGKLSD